VLTSGKDITKEVNKEVSHKDEVPKVSSTRVAGGSYVLPYMSNRVEYCDGVVLTRKWEKE